MIFWALATLSDPWQQVIRLRSVCFDFTTYCYNLQITISTTSTYSANTYYIES